MPDDPFYKSLLWKYLRQDALRRDRYICTVRGCTELATHVDHIVSKRDGGPDALSNLRSLCALHDNQTKEDSTGKRRRDGKHHVPGCDANGNPLDPSHWWNKKSLTAERQRPAGPNKLS
jgi:5-methylcytosine-specific restriction protein A